MKAFNRRCTNPTGKKGHAKYLLFGFLALVVLTVFGYASTIINNNEIISSQQIIGSVAGISGQNNRTLISNGNITVTVCAAGCNYATIQDSLLQMPIFLRHTYKIIIKDGTYNENVWIPPSIIEDITDPIEGSIGALWITGNISNRNGVKINSIHLSSEIGSQNPTIDYLTITGRDPYSDENVSIGVYGSNHPVFRFINITSNAEYGIMSYGSSITTTGIDYGNGNLENAMLVKHGGDIYSINVASFGYVREYVALIAGGNIYSKGDNITSGVGEFFTSSTTTGLYLKHNVNERVLYGVTEFGTPLHILNISSSGTNKVINSVVSGNTGSNYAYYLQHSGTGRSFLLYQSNEASTNQVFEVQNEGKGEALLIDQNGAGIGINIDNVGNKSDIKLSLNSTFKICDNSQEGGIYYNGNTKQFYGCNSTNWNLLG